MMSIFFRKVTHERLKITMHIKVRIARSLINFYPFLAVKLKQTTITNNHYSLSAWRK